MSTNKKELLRNAMHWLGEAKKNGLKENKIGCAFVFWDETDADSAVCVSTVDKARLAREFETIIKKIEDRLIVDPYGRN